MLHNVLARQLPVEPAQVAAALAAAGIAPDRRPQTRGGGGVAGAARGVRRDRPDRRGRRGDEEPRRDARRPARRLTPVVRLAPAKLNLTLAVVGRRPDGYHALHSVMAPLALADRLSLAPDRRPAPRDTPPRRRASTPVPTADNLVLRAIDAARRAVRPQLGDAAAGARRPARQADPGRGGAGRRQQRRRRGDRRRPRGVVGDRRARRRPSVRRSPPRSAATCRSSSPAARPSSRAAASGSRRSAGSASRRRAAPGRPPRHAGGRGPHRGGLRGLGRRRDGPARRRARRSSEHFASRVRVRAERAASSSSGPACWPSPTTSCRPRRPSSTGLVAAPPGADAAARPADRAVRLRADPVGALSFARRRRARRGVRPGRRRRPASSPPRATAPPFVAATTFLITPDEPTDHREERAHDPPGDPDERRARPRSARTARRSGAASSCSARASSGSIRRPASSPTASRPRPSARSATSSRSSTRPASASTTS